MNKKFLIHFWGKPVSENDNSKKINNLETGNKIMWEIYLGENHLFVKNKDDKLYGYGSNSYN